MRDDILISSGSWGDLGEMCRDIRCKVFVEEQGVDVHEELDALDPDCIHFLLYYRQTACGTARLLPDGHIGRVAILSSHRGLGLGAALMREIIDMARQQKFQYCVLSAQTHALGFYERLGFVARGPEYMDAGIPHREMNLPLA